MWCEEDEHSTMLLNTENYEQDNSMDHAEWIISIKIPYRH